MIFTVVPKEHVKNVWHDVARVLEKSVETSGGKYQTIDVLKGILDNVYVLWVVVDEKDDIIAAVTTRLIVYPHKLGMALDWVGGTRMFEWSDMAMDAIVRYARENGCTHIEGYGRKAWERFARKYHSKPEYIAYRIDLDGAEEINNEP